MTVYGRFFKLYMYTALAPIPLSTFAGEPSQNVGKYFIKSSCAVCLEGAVIVLSCIIFSLFASSPPVVLSLIHIFSSYQINVDRDTANVCFIGMESLEKIKGTKEVNAAAYDRV